MMKQEVNQIDCQAPLINYFAATLMYLFHKYNNTSIEFVESFQN